MKATKFTPLRSKRKPIASLVILLLSLILIVPQGHAQDSIPKIWDFGGLTTLGFSQMSFTNWSAGGDDSYSLNTLANLHCNYNKGGVRWDNALSLAYGFVNQNKKFKKTDDRIEFYSKYGYQAAPQWFYSGMLSFKSQFSPGYESNDGVKGNLMSKFLAPGYVQASFGMEYRPNEVFKVMLSPMAYRMTMVLDDSLSHIGSYGVTPDHRTHNEFGGSVFATYRKDNIVKNVNLSTTLGLFSNYFHKPLNIDVDWQVLLSLKINDFLSTTISTQLLYDDDTKVVDANGVEGGACVQFKEVLSVGLQYKF